MYCGKCGTKANPGQKFCITCGGSLAPVTVPAVQKPQPNVVNAPPAVTIPQPVLVNTPPVMTVPQAQVQSTQTINPQQIPNGDKYDWNRVQPRKRPAGGRALIWGLSILTLGLVFLIWALAVAVGG